MWIDGALAAQLYAKRDFSNIQVGEWVFVFRRVGHWLDAQARPELVVSVQKGRITTQTRLTFRQSDGDGSYTSKKTKHLRIVRYTEELKVALESFFDVRRILTRIAELDLSGLGMTHKEAESLEMLLTRYAERKTATEGKFSRRGRVSRTIRKHLVKPPPIRWLPVTIYRERPEFAGITSILLGRRLVHPGDVIMVDDEDRWYRLTPEGRSYEIDLAVPHGIALERAVKCQRLHKVRSRLTSI